MDNRHVFISNQRDTDRFQRNSYPSYNTSMDRHGDGANGFFNAETGRFQQIGCPTNLSRLNQTDLIYSSQLNSVATVPLQSNMTIQGRNRFSSSQNSPLVFSNPNHAPYLASNPNLQQKFNHNSFPSEQTRLSYGIFDEPNLCFTCFKFFPSYTVLMNHLKIHIRENKVDYPAFIPNNIYMEENQTENILQTGALELYMNFVGHGFMNPDITGVHEVFAKQPVIPADEVAIDEAPPLEEEAEGGYMSDESVTSEFRPFILDGQDKALNF